MPKFAPAILLFAVFVVPQVALAGDEVDYSAPYLVVEDGELSFIQQALLKDPTLSAWWGFRPRSKRQPIEAIRRVAMDGNPDNQSENRYLARMRESFEWFLGANRLGLSLYNSSTAGCQDGLGAQEVNKNQGAESVVSFLLALLAMLGLADDGLDWNAVEIGLTRPDSARAEVLIRPSERAPNAIE